MTRILVVDDNADNLELLKVLLGGNGYTTVLAHNGRDALRAARDEPPAVAISDILMPVMDGYALCREWMSDPTLRDIPFVFYTATYTDPKDEEFARDLGATDFFIKPMEPEPFLAMIRQVLDRFRHGTLEAHPIPPPTETEYLREYNETLIRKLEDKLEQLGESEARLTAALDAGRMGVWEWTVGTDDVQTWNAKGVFGLSPEHVVRTYDDFLDLIHPDDRAEVERVQEAAVSGAGDECRITFRMAGTADRWCDCRGVVARTPGGEAVAMAGTIADITAEREADFELRASRDALRRLAHRLVDIREQEYRAMAREVHDVLGQNLVALRLEVEAFGQSAAGSDELEERKRDLHALITQSAETVQQLAARLRPPALEALGLHSALIEGVRQVERHGELQVGVDVDETVETAPVECKLALYRIAMEACTNVVQHAQADHVEIRATADNGVITLTVRDDGIGISDEYVDRFGSLGLLGMYERAQALGGQVSVAPHAGGGTEVRATIPIASKAPAAGDRSPVPTS